MAFVAAGLNPLLPLFDEHPPPHSKSFPEVCLCTGQHRVLRPAPVHLSEATSPKQSQIPIIPVGSGPTVGPTHL